MKKLLILSFLLAVSSVTLKAQDQIKDQDRDQTRLMMVDGDLLQIRDRDQTQLKDKITLEDGTILSPNGRYVTRDGEKLRLRDGELLDNDGIKYNNEYQYRYKIMKENAGLSQQQMRERNENRIHYIAMDGNVFRIRNMEQNRIENQLSLNNGMKINPDGTYQDRNKNQLRLRDGECLSLDGMKYQNALQVRRMMTQKQNMSIQNMNKKNMQMQKQIQNKSAVQKKASKNRSGLK